MHWQVHYCFELETDGKLKLVTMHATPIGFCWWWPMDWVQWFRTYRYGIRAETAPRPSAYVLGEAIKGPLVKVEISELRPSKVLPPGTVLRAHRGMEIDRADLEDVILHLPSGGTIEAKPNDEIPF